MGNAAVITVKFVLAVFIVLGYYNKQIAGVVNRVSDCSSIDTFGPGNRQRCRCDLEEDAVCDKDTGQCTPDKCEPGWLGTACQYWDLIAGLPLKKLSVVGSSYDHSRVGRCIDGLADTCCESVPEEGNETAQLTFLFHQEVAMKGMIITTQFPNASFENFKVYSNNDTLCYSHGRRDILQTMEVVFPDFCFGDTFYIRLNYPGITMTLCEIQAYCGREISYNSDASASSVYNEWYPDNVVDGRSQGAVFNQALTCFKSESYLKDQWLVIDLGNLYRIDAIRWWAAVDLDDMEGFSISAYENMTSGERVVFADDFYGNYSGDRSRTIFLTQSNVMARYIKFERKCEVISGDEHYDHKEAKEEDNEDDDDHQQQITTTQAQKKTLVYERFSICEIQVLGECGVENMCGFNCTVNCPCIKRNQLSLEMKYYGICEWGCDLKWIPDPFSNYCIKECGFRLWGENCDKECGHCYDHTDCNAVNGHCFRECDSPFLFPMCTEFCTEGTYGYRCRGWCGKCANDEICSSIRGICQAGCQPGWLGESCVLPDPGCDRLPKLGEQELYFGENCRYKCHCRKTYTSMFGALNWVAPMPKDECLENGECKRGCAQGWISYRCQYRNQAHYNVIESDDYHEYVDGDLETCKPFKNFTLHFVTEAILGGMLLHFTSPGVDLTPAEKERLKGFKLSYGKYTEMDFMEVCYTNDGPITKVMKLECDKPLIKSKKVRLQLKSRENMPVVMLCEFYVLNGHDPYFTPYYTALNDLDEKTCSNIMEMDNIELTFPEAELITRFELYFYSITPEIEAALAEFQILYQVPEVMDTKICHESHDDHEDVIKSQMDVQCEIPVMSVELTLELRSMDLEEVNLCEIQIYGGRELAFNKNTQSDQPYEDWWAYYAVDGVTSVDHVFNLSWEELNALRYCFVSIDTAHPFLVINLLAKYEMIGVHLYLYDHDQQAGQQFQIRTKKEDVSDEIEEWEEKGITMYSPYAPQILNFFPTTVTLVWVNLVIPLGEDDMMLMICEVYVFGDCPPDKCGFDCSMDCYCGTYVDSESKLTGDCPWGCKGRWTGPDKKCNIECPEDKWGETCQNDCGHCYYESCRASDGICTYRCDGTWQPEYCVEECEDGTYGQNCIGTCGECLLGEICNKNTGICDSGCKQGYKRPLCNERIPDCYPDTEFSYTFGENCEHLCHCFNQTCSADGICPVDDRYCEENDMTCLSNRVLGTCKYGFEGPSCQYEDVAINFVQTQMFGPSTTNPSDFAKDGTYETCAITNAVSEGYQRWVMELDNVYFIERICIIFYDAQAFASGFTVTVGISETSINRQCASILENQFEYEPEFHLACSERGVYGRFIEVKISNPRDIFGICEIRILGGRDVSFNKRTWQSSFEPGHWAYLAVDRYVAEDTGPEEEVVNDDSNYDDDDYGETAEDIVQDPDLYRNTCFISNRFGEHEPWWKIDLGQRYEIQRIELYAPRTETSENYTISIDTGLTENTTEHVHTTLLFKNPNFTKSQWTVRPVIIAQFIKIYRPMVDNATYIFLELCDVKIFAECPVYMCGKNCDIFCYCEQSRISVFNKLSGVCPGKQCVGRWTGVDPDDCNIECNKHSWGEMCRHECGFCKDYGPCEMSNGFCTEGCQGAFKPPTCTKKCRPGSYGMSCQGHCGYCSMEERCNIETGLCTHGCEIGYEMPMCQTLCPERTYGFNCTPCGKCYYAGKCDRSKGECLDHKCLIGLQPPMCDKFCQNGTYGKDCAQKCGKCFGGYDFCDHVSGLCKNKRCDIGYSDLNCQRTCPNGTYGENCTLECGHCFGPPKCHHVTGMCPFDCVEGYKPPECVKAAKKPLDFKSGIAFGVTGTIVLLVFGCMAAAHFYRLHLLSLEKEERRRRHKLEIVKMTYCEDETENKEGLLQMV